MGVQVEEQASITIKPSSKPFIYKSFKLYINKKEYVLNNKKLLYNVENKKDIIGKVDKNYNVIISIPIINLEYEIKKLND